MMPFGLKIAIINRTFRKKLDEKAASLGLTAVQLRVLGSISRLEAAGETEIHQNDLERIEQVTHPAMTKLLQRLESKELIRCVPSSQDRRYKKITCTEQSTDIYKIILEQDAEVFTELCKNLTEDQKQQFIQLADIILKSIGSE
jgi:DNA-binding MarR family transcriptional regulator